MNIKSSKLFEQFSLNRLKLRNRIVMAPMTRRMANDDGRSSGLSRKRGSGLSQSGGVRRDIVAHPLRRKCHNLTSLHRMKTPNKQILGAEEEK